LFWGCYVGREVIVRVTHRGGGRVAKLVRWAMGRPPVPHRARALSAGRDIGRVTSAAFSPGETPVGLGYVQRDFVTPGTEVTAVE
jgi:glycine cleavage system aminomethyltransferase T